MGDITEKYIEELYKADTLEKYDKCFQGLIQCLSESTEYYDAEILRHVRDRGKYLVNKFSDESTKENMIKAKENLIFYLNSVKQTDGFSGSKLMQNCLAQYLENFYLFLEAFREVKLDKRASLSDRVLETIQIKNEYDLQHLLFAVLRPLFPDIRKEVAEDSGVGTIRSDLKIPSINTIIEAKCTRTTMTQKKLVEEIEADIVHYQAERIYFYVYDKEKMIKDKHAAEQYFSRSFDRKIVKIVIIQPIYI